MSNWVEDIIAELEVVETPRSWLYWSLIAAISASAANSYYLKAFNGAVTYKPNLYVILLGPPGLGKAFGITLAEGLVRRADVTRVISGRSSIQAILTELSKAVTREKKGPIMDSRAFVTAGELSTAIIKDPQAMNLLTDLFDCKDLWENSLKKDETKEKLKNNYITFLAGSSEAHFRDAIPESNIEGGLISRTLIIQEESRYKDLDLLTEENEESALLEKIFAKYSPHLEKIAEGGGRIVPTIEAKTIFNNWRREWRIAQKGKEDVTGFLNRVPDHAIKVAMLLSLAEHDLTLLIKPEHVEEAISRVTPLTYSIQKQSEGKAQSDDSISPHVRTVLDLLLMAEGHQLRRKQLLVKCYNTGRGIDSNKLDAAISTLEEINWIKKDRLVAGKNSDIIITLQGEPLEQYKKFVNDRGHKLRVVGGDK